MIRKVSGVSQVLNTYLLHKWLNLASIYIYVCVYLPNVYCLLEVVHYDHKAPFVVVTTFQRSVYHLANFKQIIATVAAISSVQTKNKFRIQITVLQGSKRQSKWKNINLSLLISKLKR